jgi:hypothetical protein
LDNLPRLNLKNQIQHSLRVRLDRYRMAKLSVAAAKAARPDPAIAPVLFFNATARLGHFSQNAAFSYLAAIGLQAARVPVVHFGCRAGLSRCVLASVGRRADQHPPCKACIAQSERLYAHAPTVWFKYQTDSRLQTELQGLNLLDLSEFEIDFDGGSLPLGRLGLHSLRWAQRRYDLDDNDQTRYYLRAYMLSAYHLAREYATLIDRLEPGALVIFNGVMVPEATARWVGLQRGYRVITYEVAYEPLSAFFTDGLATRYPIDIPADFELNEVQNKRIDDYLEKRFQGQFTMAGIRFWPEMRGLDPEFLKKAARFKQIVPVFTNVIYDTSQVDTNVTFTHMFGWLDQVLEIIRRHPETLFVIRAHPDEIRPGKESRQSVQMWVSANQVDILPNVSFIPPREYLSSYELIGRSKFVLVYNSSIGLEATLMGKPVICASSARYTQYPIVHFPQTPEGYLEKVEALLKADEITMPAAHIANARRFLYYQLFRASLPFDQFIAAAERPGYVHLKDFPLDRLHPDHCTTSRVIRDGILEGAPFLLPDEVN